MLRLLLMAVGAAFAAALLALSTGSTQQAQAATTLPACAPDTLEPRLSAVMINQGLASYSSTPRLLVRGKDALVRLFLTLPPTVGSTCSGSINVVNTTSAPTRLTMLNGATPLTPTVAPHQSYPSAGFAIPASTPSVNSTADPIFRVPGSRLNPCFVDTTTMACSLAAPFSVNFSASVSYTKSGATGTFSKTFSTTSETSATPISASFDIRSNALRVLVIPMGDPAQLFSTQFGVAAQQAVHQGFLAASRILPVPEGVSSELTATTGGIRYKLDLAAMLNLRSVAGAYGSDGKFCGNQSNFNTIKAFLAQHLQSYNSNSANAAAPADRVLGVVDAAISNGSALSCAEGMASTNSPEAWVRAVPDAPASGKRPAVPSLTGSATAMELLHTLGQEKQTATNTSFHSQNIQADGTAPDKAYNLATRSFVADDHSVLNFFSTTASPWHNHNTFLEQNGFATALCNFGGSLSADCSTLGTVGIAATQALRFVISGTTDGTPGQTKVVESYFSTTSLPTPTPATSEFKLVFNGASQLVVPIPVSFTGSEHDDSTHENSTLGIFSGAFTVPSGITGPVNVELRKDGVAAPLYQAIVQPTTPTVTSISNSAAGGGTTKTKTLETPEILPKPDIMFLADSTGSMGPAIANVKSNASSILATVRAATNAPRFGAADYKDFPIDAVFNPYALSVGAPIPATDDMGAAALAAIGDASSGWSAFGGGDGPEAQLYALYKLATGSASFRSDSSRIVVWFGDNPGHDPVCNELLGNDLTFDLNEANVTAALKAAGVRIVAVSTPTEFGPPTALDADPATGSTDYGVCGTPGGTAGQATRLAAATGGVHRTNVSAEDVSNAILAGLGLLPAEVTATAECDENLTLTLRNPDQIEGGGFVSPESFSVTVTSGDSLRVEERATIGTGAAPGSTLSCTITYLVNGQQVELPGGGPDPAFTDTISVTVTAAAELDVAATSPIASQLRADIFYSCGGLQLPVHIGLAPTNVFGTIAEWSAAADSTLECGTNASNGQLSVVVSDGTQQSFAGPTITISSDRKNPTAAIYAPIPNANIPKWKPFSLSGKVSDPEDGDLAASWTITGPANATFSGESGDVLPPGGTWPAGEYTITLDGMDSNGNHPAPTSVKVHVVDYAFGGFLQPVDNPPTLNTVRAGRTVPVKWQLRDGGVFVTELYVVEAIRFGATNCGAAPTDAIETVATGGTSLRYESGTNQFVYNWKTPDQPGCYTLQLLLNDGNTYVAYFKLT
jgi:hypothetical protein